MQTKIIFAAISAVLINMSIVPHCEAGLFISTGSMNTSRTQHTATLLPNGKVLVVGGDTASLSGNITLSSAELYDPATGLWTNTGSMHFPREYHTATLLQNGKVLVAGGNNQVGSVYANAELYDPATGTWTDTGLMTTNSFGISGHVRHTATLLPNGKVLVAGGDDSSLAITPLAELFDPNTETWTSTGYLGAARTIHTSTLLAGGNVLVTGGFHYPPNETLASTEIYNPTTGVWTNTGALVFARYQHTAVLLTNGQVLIVGGVNSSASWVSYSELFDPTSQTWIDNSGASPGLIANNTTTLLSSEKVLVTGGSPNGYGGQGAYMFNPGTGLWTDAGHLITERRNHTSTLLNNGSVLIAGGYSYPYSFSSAEIFYDLSTISLTGAAKTVGGAFQFSFTNTPGAVFSVFTSTNVAQPFSNWIGLGAPTEISPGQFQFTDLQATNNSRRFYRVRSN